MAETKYGKCFLTYEGKQNLPVGRILANFDGTVVKGSFSYVVHWTNPGQDFLNSVNAKIGHPPHLHREAEILFHIGMNPEDPMDLGAEVEFYIGEKMERHVITTTSVTFIPPMVIHAPYRIIKVHRPFILVQVNQAPQKTEEYFPELLPEKLKYLVDWDSWKSGNRGF
jgi:hypothetical protein